MLYKITQKQCHGHNGSLNMNSNKVYILKFFTQPFMCHVVIVCVNELVLIIHINHFYK